MKEAAKRKYYRELLNAYKHDMSKTWKLLKTVIGQHNKHNISTNSFMSGNTEIKNPHEICESFCEYFTNIGPTLANKFSKNNNSMHYMENRQSSTLFLIPTDPIEIANIIKERMKYHRNF